VELDWGPTTVPSPKSNRYDVIVPSGSEEAEALAVTWSGAVPEDGVTVRRATGGWLLVPLAATTAEVPGAAPVSVTVTLQVHCPARRSSDLVELDWGPTTVPSPKSNR